MITKLSIQQLQDNILARFNNALIMEDTEETKISLSDIKTSSDIAPTLEQLEDNKILFVVKEEMIVGLTYIKSINEDGSEIQIAKTLFAEEAKSATKLSELENDTNFITNAVDDLVEYYKKTDTYTQEEVDVLIAKVKAEAGQFDALVVEALPTEDISTTTIYLVSKEDSADSDVYTEYMYIKENWEIIGSTEIDISNLVTIEQFEELQALIGTETPLETLEQTLVEVINAHEKELEGVQVEINYLQENWAYTIKEFVEEVNTYDNKFEFTVGTMINILDEDSPNLSVVEIVAGEDRVNYDYVDDNSFITELENTGVTISYYKFKKFTTSEVDVENLVYSDEENTFTELQTFEGGIKVTAENKICIEADGTDKCTNITGYDDTNNGIKVEVEMGGDFNFETNGYKVLIDGEEIGAGGTDVSKVQELIDTSIEPLEDRVESIELNAVLPLVDGREYKANDVVIYNGTLYKCNTPYTYNAADGFIEENFSSITSSAGEGYAELTKANTFIEQQTFNDGARILGSKGLVIEDNGKTTNIVGSYSVDDTVKTDVQMGGNFNFETNGNVVTIDGVEIATGSELESKVDALTTEMVTKLTAEDIEDFITAEDIKDFATESYVDNKFDTINGDFVTYKTANDIEINLLQSELASLQSTATEYVDLDSWDELETASKDSKYVYYVPTETENVYSLVRWSTTLEDWKIIGTSEASFAEYSKTADIIAMINASEATLNAKIDNLDPGTNEEEVNALIDTKLANFDVTVDVDPEKLEELVDARLEDLEIGVLDNNEEWETISSPLTVSAGGSANFTLLDGIDITLYNSFMAKCTSASVINGIVSITSDDLFRISNSLSSYSRTFILVAKRNSEGLRGLSYKDQWLEDNPNGTEDELREEIAGELINYGDDWVPITETVSSCSAGSYGTFVMLSSYDERYYGHPVAMGTNANRLQIGRTEAGLWTYYNTFISNSATKFYLAAKPIKGYRGKDFEWEDFTEEQIETISGETITDIEVIDHKVDYTTYESTNTVKVSTSKDTNQEFDIVTTGIPGPEGPQGIQGVSGVSADMSSEWELLNSSSFSLGVDGYKTLTVSDKNLFEYVDFAMGGATWGQGKVKVISETTLQVYNNTTWTTSLSGVYGRKMKGQISDPSVIGPQGEQGPAGENGMMTQEIYDALIARIEALESKATEGA